MAFPVQGSFEPFDRVLVFLFTFSYFILSEWDKAVMSVLQCIADVESSRAGSGPLPQTPDRVDAVANLEGLKEAQRFLMRGQTLDACSAAVRTANWAHAFIMASQISREAFSDVLVKFIEATLGEGDPLRIVYYMYAQRLDLACMCFPDSIVDLGSVDNF